MVVSAAEFVNFTGHTTSYKLLAVFVDSGASEHRFDGTPGLRERYCEIFEEPRTLTSK